VSKANTISATANKIDITYTQALLTSIETAK
jgi:hypothetical protein